MYFYLNLIFADLTIYTSDVILTESKNTIILNYIATLFWIKLIKHRKLWVIN